MTIETMAVLTLGDGWTDAIRLECALRCGDEFGDPPCWSLAGDTIYGDTPPVLTPCNECARKGADHGRD